MTHDRKINFFVAFLIIVISIVFQLKFGVITGYGYDFVLASLIAASFFLNFLELLVLVFFGIYLLNWQPGVSVEMISVFVLPIIFFWGKRVLPGKAWFVSTGFLLLGILIFYSVVDFMPMFYSTTDLKYFWDGLWPVLGSTFGNLFFGVLFGVLIFRVLGYFYEKKEYDW